MASKKASKDQQSLIKESAAICHLLKLIPAWRKLDLSGVHDSGRSPVSERVSAAIWATKAGKQFRRCEHRA